ncbi:MAG: FxsA family protein [Deltaproteobacteria bacterium]|nr:FxsA family protein [Deltaproteobacteria bacterium]
MLFKLFLLFTIVPAIELALLITIGTRIGALNTIVIVLATGFIGAYMVRAEGLDVVRRLQRTMAEGAFPAEEILDGVMVLVSGALLITPGVMTDIIGFLMVIPKSREPIKRLIKIYLKGKVYLGIRRR